MKAGIHWCDITGVFQERFEVPPANLPSGTYRNILGNQALSMGLIAASELSGLPLFLGSYPITPASDILHQLSGHKEFGVLTFQAEDEIAAVCAAIGASYAGNLAVTTTSGPGLALKAEAIGLATMTELPLIIIDVQRGGPSTGLPTKTEQADLLQALYGRNGECPVAVLAAKSPADCFDVAIEAARVAIRHMVPVLLLSDGSIANGAEPWPVPKVEELEKIPVSFAETTENFLPYARNEATLARPWAIPGTEGLTHRIGGLEKQDLTGEVSYDPMNHDRMSHLRAEKVARIADFIEPAKVEGAASGRVLILSWGGTYGQIAGPVHRALDDGASLGWVHLRWLNPLPKNLGEIIKQYDRVVVPELNLGQLVKVIRAEYGVDAIPYNKIQGRPFQTAEIEDLIARHLA